MENKLLLKKNACTRTCILNILSLLSDSKDKRNDIIKRFVEEFKFISDLNESSKIFYTFLTFLRSSKIVKCKLGIFYFEKYLLVSDYEILFFDHDSFYKNQLVNNKVVLFDWIKPQHLEIELHPEYLNYVNSHIYDINTLFTPSEKLFQIIELSKIIYQFHGKDLCQGKFLPIFIYTLIYFQVKNLYHNLIYMQRYFTIPIQNCRSKCPHLENSSNEKCECTDNISSISFKEQKFYLLNLEAAICFIEKIDFSLLNVELEEYCRNLDSRVHRIDTSKQPKKISKEISFIDRAKFKAKSISYFVQDYIKKQFKK